MLDELAKHASLLHKAMEKCWSKMSEMGQSRQTTLEIPAELFHAMPDISLDYAVMEHSAKVAVIPCDIGWSDIGSWNALAKLVGEDSNHNRAIGDAVFVNSEHVFARSEDRLVAAVGVEHLMIIDTPDALLVASPGSDQEVKQVVAELKRRDHDTYKLHTTVMRPWGTYTVLEEGPRFKIKRVEVKPGASLSLQRHEHRSEHWVIVSGTAKVTNNDQVYTVAENESTFIPARHKHRLENAGTTMLVLIEVQSGDYVGEDDITRFKDRYGREISS
jgi:mannose-1-phosphate guanylyltransferase